MADKYMNDAELSDKLILLKVYNILDNKSDALFSGRMWGIEGPMPIKQNEGLAKYGFTDAYIQGKEWGLVNYGEANAPHMLILARAGILDHKGYSDENPVAYYEVCKDFLKLLPETREGRMQKINELADTDRIVGDLNRTPLDSYILQNYLGK